MKAIILILRIVANVAISSISFRAHSCLAAPKVEIVIAGKILTASFISPLPIVGSSNLKPTRTFAGTEYFEFAVKNSHGIVYGNVVAVRQKKPKMPPDKLLQELLDSLRVTFSEPRGRKWKTTKYKDQEVSIFSITGVDGDFGAASVRSGDTWITFSLQQDNSYKDNSLGWILEAIIRSLRI